MRKQKTQKQASFAATKEDAAIIAKIVDRGVKFAKGAGHKDITSDRQSFLMDITACHCSGNPLQLQRLLDADDFNFCHDFFGINRNINRVTGKLMDFFVPRFSA